MKNLFLLAMIVTVCAGLALAAFVSPAADTEIAQADIMRALRIVVVPSTTNVHVGVPFDVLFRVENTSRGEEQTVVVMSCGWSEHWEPDDTNLVVVGQPCFANAPIRIFIAPGQAYTNEGSMEVVRAVPGDKLSFRMGFTPLRSDNGFALGSNTLWSSNVVLTVTP